jgi:hypothetical protein
MIELAKNPQPVFDQLVRVRSIQIDQHADAAGAAGLAGTEQTALCFHKLAFVVCGARFAFGPDPPAGFKEFIEEIAGIVQIELHRSRNRAGAGALAKA